jgi:hypothetical protein
VQVKGPGTGDEFVPFHTFDEDSTDLHLPAEILYYRDCS